MKIFALAGNPNCGKTTLFNSLTGSTAHVGNWPGVTVEKREGTYKKGKEQVKIVDLPGIYSLSPYTPEEVVSRNVILNDKPDCVINIVDATNLERNLYLTTQIIEMDVPVIVALNMMDEVKRSGDKLDVKKLESKLGVPVVEISALREQNLDLLMEKAIETSEHPRNGITVLEKSPLTHLIQDVTIAFKGKDVDNPLFHAIKLIENDEIEVKEHPDLLKMVNEFKDTFSDDIFGNDFEAIVADARYKYITSHYSPAYQHKNVRSNSVKLTISDKIDRVFTNKWAGIPIFILILFLIFHITFSEDLFFLHTFGVQFGTNFEGNMFENLFYSPNGINSLGVFFTNFLNSITGSFTELVGYWLKGTEPWASALVCDGILGGLFAVIGFLPQILLLFLFFSTLEDSGYMARAAFILDRIFRKFGVSGRAFLPMIMGFGCSVPAMVNTRTLADEKERVATIRVIPFFSCGAKLPILTGCIGALVAMSGIGYADLIVLSMYVLGMTVALFALIIMKKTTMRGEVSPFIMELPAYHLPQGKSLAIHVWDKAKDFLKKAFTLIFISTIVVWLLQSFTPSLKFIAYDAEANKFLTELTTNDSILANIGRSFQFLFTPLGFGSQLGEFGWVFAVAAITGLVAKENVISTFAMLGAVISATGNIPDIGSTIEGAQDVANMINATGANVPTIISFVAFNMLTIPCFASVATAKAELKPGTLKYTLGFWILTSYVVSTMIYTIGTWWWTLFIWAGVAILLTVALYFYNKYRDNKMIATKGKQ